MPFFESSTDLPLAPASPARPLTFRLVTTRAELESLAPAWQALLDESASPEPMLAPTWLLTWWRVYGEHTGRRLHVGLLYDGNQLIGMAPFCKRRYWHRPGIPMTRIEFLGADVDENDGVCSEYLNLIACRGQEERVARQFVHELHHGSFGGWHELVLGAMNGDVAMPCLLRDAFAARGHRTECVTTTESPFLSLPANWDAYLKSLPKKRRHNVTSALRAFEAWAGSEWQLQEARDGQELERGQQILWDLHNRRWQEADGRPGAFAASRFSAFHRAYLPQLLCEGKLDLFWLTVRGQPIAAHYQIIAHQKAYFYQCGRALDVPEKVRPGIVMVALALQRAIRQGLREFDFLGGPAFYKSEFTKTNRPIVTLRVARPGLRESLRGAGERAVTWLRNVRNRYRSGPPSVAASGAAESDTGER